MGKFEDLRDQPFDLRKLIDMLVVVAADNLQHHLVVLVVVGKKSEFHIVSTNLTPVFFLRVEFYTGL